MKKIKLLNLFQKPHREMRTLIRLSLFMFFLLASSNIFSKSYSQVELRLNFKNTKVENIISFIEKRTDYRFLYQTSQVDLKRKVNINFKGNTYNAVKVLFKGTTTYPVIIDKQIVLKEKTFTAQDRILTGTVTDEDNIPLEGVTILVNKFTRGTTTNANGNYKINVKAGDKVSFSYIGFKDQVYTIADQTVINVTLKDDMDILEEVVLIGYGKAKKESVATAISTIKGEALETNLQSGSTFDRGIEGLVKGVFVTQNSGELGKNADIIIRGVTSPFSGSNNNPLYIIDGVAVTPPSQLAVASGYGFNPLEAMNPDDIESVEVLKDAAATAIYGSRGANGVIIVKTKTGLYNQPTTVKLSVKSSFGTPIRTLDYLNATEFKKHILTLSQNSYDHYKSGTDPDYGFTLQGLPHFGFSSDIFTGEITYDPSKIKFGSANTNWNKEVYRDVAVSNRYNVTVNGGGENVFYGLSVGHTNQEGTLKADKRKLYNARLNTQFNIFDNLTVGASVNYVHTKQNTGYNNSAVFSGFNFLGSVLRFRPDVPVYDKDGNHTFTIHGSDAEPIRTANPVAMTTLSSQRELLNNSILANIFAEYSIIDNLTFKADYSYSIFFSDSNDYKPKEYDLNGSTQFSETQLFIDNAKSKSSVINYTLNYNKIVDKHSFTGLLGYSYTEDYLSAQRGLFNGLVSNLRNPQFASNTLIKDKRASTSGLNSAFTRLSYTYNDKYGISGVLRLDRSSKYAPENRNAFFPSVSANWNIHKENFMNNSYFNELRLRASYGHTGSSVSEDFIYLQTFDVVGENLKYNGQVAAAYGQNFANKKLQWERTKEYNLGLDFNTKRNTLRGSVDFYHKTTTDAVSNDRVISETGADQFQRNNATILNKGFEVSLGSNIIDSENFRWSIDVNVAKNINKLLAVSDVVVSGDNSSIYSIGREVNLIKGYVVNGIIKDQARIDELNANAKAKGYDYYDEKGTGVGDYEYKDINGDGRIDTKDSREIIGSRQPDLFGGFNTKLHYKGISLGAYFSYAYGLESLRGSEFFNNGKFINVERYLSADNRWSPTNTSATLPRLIHKNDEDRTSTANVFDASFLRLTALKLGYDLPVDMIEKIKLSKVNLYVTGSNLATWTNFPGIDPQGVVGGSASPENRSNEDAYPTAKTFSLGVNIEF